MGNGVPLKTHVVFQQIPFLCFFRLEKTARHVSTFGRYLWWDLLSMISAPFLPVPSLLFRQSRRLANHTGDRLS